MTISSDSATVDDQTQDSRDCLDIMQAYIDSAKSFIQLSSAALVLPVLLRTKVLGIAEGQQVTGGFEWVAVCFSWFCFMIAIGSGVFYQYVAIKFVEYERYGEKETHISPVLRPLVKDLGPGIVYGAMVIAFFTGAICVVAYSFSMLRA